MPGKRKADAPGSAGLDDIREILDLLEERGISEFELERNGFRVRIKRRSVHEIPPRAAAAAHLDAHHLNSPLEDASAAHTATPSPAPSAPSGEPATEPAAGLYLIKSPIVGTFYAAPSPDAPPFVKPGQIVKPGQVLCIIEAMKLMNEIEAEVAGEITRVFVESGQPVEYGQSLFAIIPSESPGPDRGPR
ncbi:MAG: acetyl-CoA carboxylase biotin carboxyl carrier protein [Terriglobia bacterium]